jgi:hypothetical protein
VDQTVFHPDPEKRGYFFFKEFRCCCRLQHLSSRTDEGRIGHGVGKLFYEPVFACKKASAHIFPPSLKTSEIDGKGLFRVVDDAMFISTKPVVARFGADTYLQPDSLPRPDRLQGMSGRYKPPAALRRPSPANESCICASGCDCVGPRQSDLDSFRPSSR